jgi:large subunit ribosomal protein L25
MPEVALRLHTREQISLTVQTRQERGKGAINRLRNTHGLVPGILYGHKQPPVAFKTDAHVLQRIFKRVGQSVLFSLQFEGEDRPSEQAIVRDTQYHKVRGNVMHLDLLRINPQERLVVNIPVHTVGVPVGVRLGGGAMQHAVNALDLECVISEMPSSIEIDISSLEIGDSIHVADLLKQEPRIVTDAGVAIVNVLAPRLTIDEELEREAAEEGAAEEEDAEGAEEAAGEEPQEA